MKQLLFKSFLLSPEIVHFFSYYVLSSPVNYLTYKMVTFKLLECLGYLQVWVICQVCFCWLLFLLIMGHIFMFLKKFSLKKLYSRQFQAEKRRLNTNIFLLRLVLYFQDTASKPFSLPGGQDGNWLSDSSKNQVAVRLSQN